MSVTSGSFTTNLVDCGDNQYRALEFSWSLTSQSQANRTSTISYTLKGTGSGGGWVESRNFKLTFNGTTIYSSASNVNLYLNTVITSGSYTFNHDSSGACSVEVYAEAAIYYYGISSTGGATYVLPPFQGGGSTGEDTFMNLPIVPNFPNLDYCRFVCSGNNTMYRLSLNSGGGVQVCWSDPSSTTGLTANIIFPYKSIPESSNIITSINGYEIHTDTSIDNEWIDITDQITFTVKHLSHESLSLRVNPHLCLAQLYFTDMFVNIYA